MKPSGIFRRLDPLGRVVIPKAMLITLGWHAKDKIDVSSDGEAVILRKQILGCVFCSSPVDTVEHMGRRVCGKCRGALR